MGHQTPRCSRAPTRTTGRRPDGEGARDNPSHERGEIPQYIGEPPAPAFSQDNRIENGKVLFVLQLFDSLG